jgi:hypothetical protein
MVVMHGRRTLMNVFTILVGSGSNEQDLDGAFMIDFLTASGVTGSNTDKVHDDGCSAIGIDILLDGSLSRSDLNVLTLSLKNAPNM